MKNANDKNKRVVLEAFDTLFNKRDYVAALGGQFKSGQLGSDQNRPTEWPGTVRSFTRS